MSLTHDVFNQSPPFEDVDLFTLQTGRWWRRSRPMAGRRRAKRTLRLRPALGFGAMAARGRLANENTPKLAPSIPVATAATRSSFIPPITN